MERMTSKQRFMAALRGEPVDRPPAASITSVANYELMDVVGVHFPEGNIEPEPMATLAAAAHDVMGFDSVMPIFSIAQEATALGCYVDWSDPKIMTMYRDFLLPLHKELIPQVPAPVILHCCGPTQDRIKYFREVGFAAFHFESKVPAEVAVSEAAGKLKLAGNVNNPVTLLTRGPAEVRAEAQRAIDAGVDIITPECAIPLQTPIANLKEIVQTCEDNRGRGKAFAQA